MIKKQAFKFLLEPNKGQLSDFWPLLVPVVLFTTKALLFLMRITVRVKIHRLQSAGF